VEFLKAVNPRTEEVPLVFIPRQVGRIFIFQATKELGKGWGFKAFSKAPTQFIRVYLGDFVGLVPSGMGAYLGLRGPDLTFGGFTCGTRVFGMGGIARWFGWQGFSGNLRVKVFGGEISGNEGKPFFLGGFIPLKFPGF